jgi:hypothetical protein
MANGGGWGSICTLQQQQQQQQQQQLQPMPPGLCFARRLDNRCNEPNVEIYISHFPQ